MHATIENLVTCSHPKECVQPESQDFVMPDGTVLGFFDYHSAKLEWELPIWTEKWNQKMEALAAAEAMHDNLVNENSEEFEADDELEELLAEEEPSKSFDLNFDDLNLDD